MVLAILQNLALTEIVLAIIHNPTKKIRAGRRKEAGPMIWSEQIAMAMVICRELIAITNSTDMKI